MAVISPKRDEKLTENKKILLVSRCSWTLFNFRRGLIHVLTEHGAEIKGGGAGGDGFEEKIRDLGVPFCALPVDKRGLNPASDLRLLRALYAWYRKERPDIVHHFTIKPVIYGTIAARYAGVPKIVNTVTGLGYVFTQKDKSWLRNVVRILYRFSLKGADFTFFQNAEDQNYFLSHSLVDREKTSILPGSGVDCESFRPVAQDDVDNGRSTTFLMLSRLLKDKGIYEFVAAARAVKRKHPESRFILVGRRDERNPSVVAQEELDRWQSEGVVWWLGEVEDVRPVIAGSDVVVLPSYREGVPRSLLEAAAMEKPVITTDAVGCCEAVEHECTGLMVPVRNTERLTEAMVKMIVNPEMRVSMGVEGRKKMVREFNEKIVIHRVLQCYGL